MGFKQITLSLMFVVTSASVALAGSNGRGSSVKGDKIVVSKTDAVEIAENLYSGVLDREGGAQDIANVAAALENMKTKKALVNFAQSFAYKVYGSASQSEYQVVLARDGARKVINRLHEVFDIALRTSTREQYEDFKLAATGQLQWAVLPVLTRFLSESSPASYVPLQLSRTPLVNKYKGYRVRETAQALIYTFGRPIDSAAMAYLSQYLVAATTVGDLEILMKDWLYNSPEFQDVRLAGLTKQYGSPEKGALALSTQVYGELGLHVTNNDFAVGAEDILDGNADKLYVRALLLDLDRNWN